MDRKILIGNKQYKQPRKATDHINNKCAKRRSLAGNTVTSGCTHAVQMKFRSGLQQKATQGKADKYPHCEPT